MVKIKYDEKEKDWVKLPKESEEGIYIDGYLLEKLINIKKIISKGWDCVLLIDGAERSGKSTLGMTCGYFLSDTTLSINNFASGLYDAAQKIKDLPDGSVLIVDEGSLVFNSRDHMKRANVRLGKILDVVGQKHLVFIIILPSFFDLTKQIALRRSKFLLHVGVDEETLTRGSFSYFGEYTKSALYHNGKKNFGSYAKPSADFDGSFTDFKPDFYEDYVKLKQKSMMEALDSDSEVSKSARNDIEREIIKEICMSFRDNCPDITQEELAKGFGVSKRTIQRYCKKITAPTGDAAVT